MAELLLAGVPWRRAIWKMLLAGGAIGKKLAGKSAQKCRFCAREGSVLSGKVSEEVPHCEPEVYLYNGVEQGAPLLFVRGGEEEHIYPKEAFVPACQLFCEVLL